jgi:transposase
MIHLDTETREKLKTLRKRKWDARKHTKLSVILNLDRGLSFCVVAAIFDLDDSTIYRYAEAYNSNPLEQYLSDSYVETKAS